MSSSQPTDDAIDPIDEQLMALLDGDLEEADRLKLEKRLIEEPSLRKRLRELQRSWEMLNDLPHKTVDHRFASTTVEVVVKRATQELEALPLATNAGKRGRLTLAIAALTAFAIGIVAILVMRQLEYRGQLHDLAVAEHMDGLLRAGEADYEFLRALAKDERWQKHIARGSELGRLKIDDENQISSVALNKRPKKLAELPAEARSRLEFAWEDWNRYNETEKNTMRLRYAALLAQRDGEELLRMADLYARWLKQLPSERAGVIAGAEIAKRPDVMAAEYAQLERIWDNRAVMQAIQPVWQGILEKWEADPSKALEDAIERSPIQERAIADQLKRMLANNANTGSRVSSILRDVMRLPGADWRVWKYWMSEEDREAMIKALPQELRPENPDELDNVIVGSLRWLVLSASNESQIKARYAKLGEENPILKEQLDLDQPSKVRMLDWPSSFRGPGGGPGFNGGGRGPDRGGGRGGRDDQYLLFIHNLPGYPMPIGISPLIADSDGQRRFGDGRGPSRPDGQRNDGQRWFPPGPPPSDGNDPPPRTEGSGQTPRELDLRGPPPKPPGEKATP